MKIVIENRTAKIIDLEKLENLIKNVVVNELGKEPDSELDIMLTNDAEIASLNAKYRKKEGPTDVLSFEYGLDEDVIGDIMVSLETIEQQAKSYGNSFEEELSLMLIHGLLHILGYDHEADDEEAKVMFQRQQKYFDKFVKEG
ncbi:MAG: rRNA maturation RNase YbeY [Thermotogae bacterium]|uniref:Endoribonuclease YbeY n=1 Tax=Kosmotoga arenicorallina TaxID=688066 RepID=A0A7C5DV25_9BACT|nr:rRNA maturation RNase YbeY [Kosmotoga sp.]MCD6160143.1 rRNA maturation RNase YbeY [Kosmotoga sp.]RKX50960.1 MAG: rRNA maturation RNase YbeY [Thermotogota bacterium]HHF08565.1 rRNA maturation RNase YbeY [Kosmotoga arenicorallina]